MSGQRFIDVAPAAYAALGRVLAAVGGEIARVLEMQARQAEVTRDVPGRMLDLTVPEGVQRCNCGDGPLPVRAAVVRGDGCLVGEFLVWVKDGWLVGVEQAWFTDAAPVRWPSIEELELQ